MSLRVYSNRATLYYTFFKIFSILCYTRAFELSFTLLVLGFSFSFSSFIPSHFFVYRTSVFVLFTFLLSHISFEKFCKYEKRFFKFLSIYPFALSDYRPFCALHDRYDTVFRKVLRTSPIFFLIRPIIFWFSRRSTRSTWYAIEP